MMQSSRKESRCRAASKAVTEGHEVHGIWSCLEAVHSLGGERQHLWLAMDSAWERPRELERLSLITAELRST